MIFKLDPPSGHANSYLDIKFQIEMESSEYTEIEIINLHNKQKIEILGVSNGFIKNETTIVAKNISSIEGYINIFNRDKMNSGLENIASINIKAVAKITINGEVKEESSVLTFYNESKSADSEIIPFDFQVNNTVNLDSDRSLVINARSTVSRKYELCIKHEYSSYHFNIYAIAGNNTVNIPISVLYYELDISKSPTFDLYWVKFEGLGYSKVMNRKYIKIPDSNVTFSGKKVRIYPQPRLGPAGEILPKTFVLSDRYFVHTYRDFSGLGGEGINPVRVKKLNFFMHESQDMQIPGLILSKENTLLRQEQIQEKLTTNKTNVKQKSFLENFTNNYIRQNTGSVTTFGLSSKQQLTPNQGGCGCSRKSKNHDSV